jgi:hypothetical protein
LGPTRGFYDSPGKNHMSFESLSVRERQQARRIAKAMRAVGLDPDMRSELLHDYVRSEDRIAGLRAQENTATGASQMVITRALNVAVAERRRLHDSLFKGARRPAPVMPGRSGARETVESAADVSWREFFRTGQYRTPTESTALEAELKAAYGAPNWGPLLHDTFAEQLAEERALDEILRRRR